MLVVAQMPLSFPLHIWGHKMDFYTQITNAYPELKDKDFHKESGSISLRDDGDGIQYIAKWDYAKPIPDGLKLGK
jgi:hypothetical protein